MGAHTQGGDGDGRSGPGGTVLALVLHAHLPYVRRSDRAASLEETWFFEALSECYLPLAERLVRLAEEGIPAPLTWSLSPPLLDMLGDRGLGERFRQRMRATLDLARSDAEGPVAAWREVAWWHARRLEGILAFYDGPCGGDLPGLLADLARAGRLELATTAATHALLPAHQDDPDTLRAQIGEGVRTLERACGVRPRFFWLPECAYFPGLERYLAEAGVEACALETQGVLKATPPAPGVGRPLVCPNGVRVAARDPDLSRVVWSRAEGYPGDFTYREFHRDRSGLLEEAEVERWLGRGHRTRLPSGLKYWRVTGPGEDKAIYEPRLALARAREHARDFVRRAGAGGEGGKEARLRLAPFDAELFGHWWGEGPDWIEAVFRELAGAGGRAAGVQAKPAGEAILGWEKPWAAQPAASSWGEGGDFSFWVNPATAWIYPLLGDAAERVGRLRRAPGRPLPASREGRALRQAERTLLLAQASDWPFLIQAGTAADLGREWLEGLLERLAGLCGSLERGRVEESFLGACEERDGVWPPEGGAAGGPGTLGREKEGK